MSENPQIYLASSSPRRQELLQQMGVSFSVIPQFVEEIHKPDESPEDFVMRLALEKACDGHGRQSKGMIPVLGSDTAIVMNEQILGKPDNRDHALDMLMSLSGKTHQVLTAVALKNEQQEATALSVSEVSFCQLTRELCEQYWQTGEPADKAGSYAIQGRGSLFIRNINGSYSGVMGLPIYETANLLNQFGIDLL